MLPRGAEHVCDAGAGVEVKQRQMAVGVGEHGGSELPEWDE
jgi:hypothetical protein